MRARLAVAAIATLWLTSCWWHHASRPPPSSSSSPSPSSHDQIQKTQSRRYSQRGDSGPSAPPIDVDKIPEPVPRAEPHAHYGNQSSYTVLGHTYHVLPDAHGYVERGLASWYGNKFHGYMTSSFEPYDMYAFTAAHKTLPLPSYARVTNLENGKSVVVRINDRGPFHEDRIIDLSYAAAVKIGVWPSGVARVEVRALDPGHSEPPPARTAAVIPPPARAAVAANPPPAAVTVASRAPVAPPAAKAPPAPASASSSASSAASHIYLQIGAFGERGNAEHAAASVTRAGVDHVDIQAVEVGGHTLHRVRVGPLASVEAAQAMATRIEKLGLGLPRVAVEH